MLLCYIFIVTFKSFMLGYRSATGMISYKYTKEHLKCLEFQNINTYLNIL